MEWIDQKTRKPQLYVRVLVCVKRPCSEGVLRSLLFAAYHGDDIGWVSDLLQPVEGVTHWAIVPLPKPENGEPCDIALRNLALCRANAANENGESK